MKFYCTAAINEKMKEEIFFSSFVHDSITKFLSGVFGEISEADKETNESEPNSQLGAYVFEGLKIWITKTDDIITVLYPHEY